MAEFVRGRGRLPTAGYVVGAPAVLAGVALGGLLLVDRLTLSIEVDDAAMRTTTDRLDEVASTLDSLPTYAGTEAGPASRLDCAGDSGDLFQPAVIRTWTLLPGTEPEPSSPPSPRGSRPPDGRCPPRPTASATASR